MSMTPRTRAKIDENLELIVKDINGLFATQEDIASQRQQKLRLLIFGALQWTAEDVDAQIYHSPVTLTVAAATPKVRVGDVVTLIATAHNLPTGDGNTYQWFWASDSGPVDGTSNVGTIGTGSLSPGRYTVKAHVAAGVSPGQQADAVCEFEVTA